MCTKQQLINLGVDKLADIILTLSQDSKDTQKKLKIILAGCDTDPKKIVSLIKRDISSLKRSTRFVDFKTSGTLANQINQIRVHIMADLLQKSPSHAVELLLSLLNIHESTLERTDDSGGMVGGAFMKVCADLGTAYKNAGNTSVDNLVKLVYDRFMDDGYGIFSEIILNFRDALGDEGLKKLKLKLEQSSGQKAFNQYTYQSSKVKDGLENIADNQNDVDAYIQACSVACEPNANDSLEIAKRLINHGRSAEAINWLNSIDLTRNPNCQERKMALKVEALNLCGKYQEAQVERHTWFDITLSSKVYNEILNHVEAESIESWKNTAIQKAFNFRDPHVALVFLKELQEFKQAAKLIYQKFDDLNGDKYYTLRPIADLLSKIEPLAAILLYRKMLESPLEGTKSRQYGYAAKDLAACQTLSSKVTDWHGFKNHQLYFEEISAQHKRKSSFWSEYTYVTNKRQKTSK